MTIMMTIKTTNNKGEKDTLDLPQRVGRPVNWTSLKSIYLDTGDMNTATGGFQTRFIRATRPD